MSSPIGSTTPPAIHERPGKRNTAQSCAECRRSKLKCNRVFPCEACIRRQCAHLCPQGTLNATKGNAVLLVQNTQLRSQLSDALASKKQLEARLREYETNAPGVQRQESRGSANSGRSSEVTAVDPAGLRDLDQAVGSLSIGAEGQTKYYGETASSDHLGFLLQSHLSSLSTPESQVFAGLEHASKLAHITAYFPLGMAHCPYDKDEIFLPLIPSWDDARVYTELYYEHSAWMYDPLPKSCFEPILASIYHSYDHKTLDTVSPHALASFFIIMASGAYSMDRECEKPRLFYHLARAAFCMDSIYNKSSCSTVEALMVMVTFMLNFDSGGFEARWILMGVCVRIAQSIGLHTDSAHWNLATKEQDRRRGLFWEVFTYDAWMGLVTGRPPAMSAVQTNVRFPEDARPHINEEGLADAYGWHAWKFRYSEDCLAPVIQHIFSSRITFDSLLELDKRIREFPVPAHLKAPGPGEDSSVTWSTDEYHAMTQYCLLCEKESNLLYIHRAYFVHVLQEKPQDPLQHRFGRSVNAVYNSAHRLITSLKDVYNVYPKVIKRSWFFWSGMYSSCVVLAALVIESPKCSLARGALELLQNSIDFYDAGSKDCRPPDTLDKLNKLAHRAKRAYGSQVHKMTNDEDAPENDELSVLNGQKNVIITQTPSNSPSPQTNPHLRPSSSSPRPSGSQTERLLQTRHKRLSLPAGGDLLPSSSVRSEQGSSNARKSSSSGLRGSSLTRDNLRQSTSMGYPTSNLRGTDNVPQASSSSSLSVPGALSSLDLGVPFRPSYSGEMLYPGSDGSTSHGPTHGLFPHDPYRDQEMGVSGPAAEETRRGHSSLPPNGWSNLQDHQSRQTMQTYNTMPTDPLSSTMYSYDSAHLHMSNSYSAPTLYPFAGNLTNTANGSYQIDHQMDGSHFLYGVVDGGDFINPQSQWDAYQAKLYENMQQQTPQHAVQDLPQQNYQTQMYHNGHTHL